MENEQNLKAQLIKEKEQFELEKIAWNRIQVERANSLQKKLEDLLKIQNSTNIFDNSSSYKLNNKEEEECNKLKIELNNLKYEYNTKLSEFEQLKNNLKKEKSNFEINTNNLKNEIRIKQNIIEKENLYLIKKENEFDKRKDDLRKKEIDLNNKLEDFERLKKILIEKHNKNLIDEKDLEKAEFRKNIFHNELLEKENIIEEQKNELNKQINNIEKDKMDIIYDKKEIEEIKQEINLRMKCMDNLCEKNILQDFENINSLFTINKNDNKIKNGGENFQENGNNLNQFEQFDKYKDGNYNTDLYLMKIKNRIDLNKIRLDDRYGFTTKKFDPFKEQKFLEESYESLKKLKK